MGLLALQWKYRILKFPNPEEYYMNYIPVYMDLPTLLILNVGVLVLCLLMLLVPSWIITRIRPVRAIRFE
jgi:lipoprotein-releasing system permease protein